MRRPPSIILNLGVCPILPTIDLILKICSVIVQEKAIRAGLIKTGDKVVISAGLPVDVPGNTNIIRVVEAE